MPQVDQRSIQQGSIDESSGKNVCKINLEKPLLPDKFSSVDKVDEPEWPKISYFFSVWEIHIVRKIVSEYFNALM